MPSSDRSYKSFVHKEAVFSICCDEFEAVCAEIVKQRRILEEYIASHEEFGRSFEPVACEADAPEVARRMSQAAEVVGVGPMAAVAGIMAEFAAKAGVAAGADEAIVENGGDIFLITNRSVMTGLYGGGAKAAKNLGFAVEAVDTPVAICSSSGLMGHSTSLGECDLATVVSADAAIADAAATLAANLVCKVEDVDAALERIAAIEGVDGVLIAKDDRIGLAGKLPQLVRVR